MSRYKGSTKSKRLIWRISDRAPLGEWVDPNIPVERPKKEQELPEVTQGRWMRSSFDLLSGVDVDDSPNTVPDELFMSPPAKDKPKPPG